MPGRPPKYNLIHEAQSTKLAPVYGTAIALLLLWMHSALSSLRAAYAVTLAPLVYLRLLLSPRCEDYVYIATSIPS